MNPIGAMPNKPDIWPFSSQREYDMFNSNLKSSNHKWKEAAIQSWVAAWNAKPTEVKGDAGK